MTLKKNGNLADGLHFMYPYLCLSKELQYIITYEVMKEMEDHGRFLHIPSVNKLKDVVDFSIINSTN